MTDAVVSQVVVEALRINLAPDAQVSQLAVEVLRPNAGLVYTLSCSAGSFSMTGGAIGPIGGAIGAGALSVTGQDAALTYIEVKSGGACLLVGL